MKPALTKAGTPRKRAPGAGRKKSAAKKVIVNFRAEPALWAEFERKRGKSRLSKTAAHEAAMRAWVGA